jgi:hypothetical protein
VLGIGNSRPREERGERREESREALANNGEAALGSTVSGSSLLSPLSSLSSLGFSHDLPLLRF